jgi:hypothetical protein
MRKKYFIVTFGGGHKYEGCYTKVAAQMIEEARDKILLISSSYELICTNATIARVNELKLKYISLEQIKKEVLQEQSII